MTHLCRDERSPSYPYWGSSCCPRCYFRNHTSFDITNFGNSLRRDSASRHSGNTALAVAVLLAANCAAIAGSDSVGLTITSDRDPDDFTVPKDKKYELNGAHTFDNGLILGGSFQYTDTAFSDRASQNFEGTIGYSLPLSSVFSVNASAGIGEHWREKPSADFPYYVLRIGADVALNQSITWNAITYRPKGTRATGGINMTLPTIVAFKYCCMKSPACLIGEVVVSTQIQIFVGLLAPWIAASRDGSWSGFGRKAAAPADLQRSRTPASS